MLERNQHKAMLLRILKQIYADTTVGPCLGFKGGTAAFLFYGLDRFSVDLDFDLLDKNKEEYIFEKISAILKNHGIIREQYKKYNTVFFMLSYAEELHNIKIEISKRKLTTNYNLLNYLGIPMLVITREDMFAYKLIAMCERNKSANRDIYDIWFFLKNNWPLNTLLIEQHSGKNFSAYLKQAITYIKNYNDAYILDSIGELLNEPQKIWVKSNLKQEVLFLLKVMLDVTTAPRN
ncbi:MAG: nucleotidyl transferase AbiEii/AbiGii toxin family protein [Patescibacteria group bacterium]|jgi:predicted nucleotidyltransferase component of viral defense system